jgi:CBS domain-containing protein
MRIRNLCTPRAFTVLRDEPLAAAARMLCDRHVGALVVLERGDALRRPVGMLTDRDIVRGELRRGADLYCLTVGDVMTADPLVLPLDLGVTEAIEALGARSVRRAPLVDAAGSLQGIITLDDLLPLAAQELSGLAALIGGQARRECARPRVAS